MLAGIWVDENGIRQQSSLCVSIYIQILIDTLIHESEIRSGEGEGSFISHTAEHRRSLGDANPSEQLARGTGRTSE